MRCYINVLFVLYCRNIYQQHLWYGFSAIGRLCFRTMNSNEMHTFAQIIGTYSFTYQARSNSWVNVIGHTSRSQEELKVKKIGSVRPRVGVSFFWYIVSIGIKIARRIWELGLPRFASPFPRQTAEKFAEHIGYSVMLSQWQWTANNVRARCVRSASATGSVQVGRTDWRTAVGFVICEWNERRRERKESEWEWERVARTL